MYVLVPRHWAACAQHIKMHPGHMNLLKCPSGAAAPSKAVTIRSPTGPAIGDIEVMEEWLRPLAYQGGKCAPAYNWKRWEKQRRKAEQQVREQQGARCKRIKRGLVL